MNDNEWDMKLYEGQTRRFGDTLHKHLQDDNYKIITILQISGFQPGVRVPRGYAKTCQRYVT